MKLREALLLVVLVILDLLGITPILLLLLILGRFCLCVVPAVVIAVVVHTTWPLEVWLWYITMPLACAAILVGCWWQFRSS